MSIQPVSPPCPTCIGNTTLLRTRAECNPAGGIDCVHVCASRKLPRLFLEYLLFAAWMCRTEYTGGCIRYWYRVFLTPASCRSTPPPCWQCRDEASCRSIYHENRRLKCRTACMVRVCSEVSQEAKPSIQLTYTNLHTRVYTYIYSKPFSGASKKKIRHLQHHSRLVWHAIARLA